MRSEVIITCRGELPHNLNRTVAQAREQTNVCIVFDGSEKGNETPPGLDKACRIERPWDDCNPRGPGQARHYGIRTSKADVVILCDGHIKFGAGWHDKIVSHLAKNPKHITCMSTYNMTPKWEPLDDQILRGAFLALKTTEPQVDMHGPAREYFGICAKWTEDGPEQGVIPAPMGAVYGMTRKWYRAMGEPFSILEEWGGDEELMAICGWLCGGQTYLLDCLCGHIYSAPAKGRQIHPAGRWANRLAIARSLPDNEAAITIAMWMRKTRLPWAVIDGLIKDRTSKIKKLLKHLTKQRRTWKGLVKHLVRPWTMPELRDLPEPKASTTKRLPPAPKDDVTQIIIQKAVQCERCNKLNSFKQVAGVRPMAGGKLKWCRCSNCGHKAQIRIVQ